MTSAPDRVDVALAVLWESASAATPELEGEREAFVAYVEGLRRGGEIPPLERARDLGLAFACGRGCPSAHRRLDLLLVESAAQAARRIDPSPAFADLVAQELRTRILLGEPPPILQYAGRASLVGWLRTAATRAALNLRRGKGERLRDELPSELPLPARALDSALLATRHRGDVEAALRTAIGRLAAKQRAILALHLRDGLSSDRIAALYRVGRSTAKRWLVAAREQLSAETERELRARLALSPSEYEGVIAGVRSEVDVSLVRLLAEE